MAQWDLNGINQRHRKKWEEKCRLVCPAPKNIGWIPDIVEKFPKPGELVVDIFSSIFVTDKACLALSQNRCFVVCKIGAICFAARVEALVEMNARQVLNGKSNIQLSGRC